MTDTEKQIQAAVMHGLTKQEIEALLERKLDQEETQIYNKTKAIVKIQKMQKEEAEEEEDEIKVNPQSQFLTAPISKRYTKEQILDIVYRTHGLTTSICKALDCTHNQWHVYLRKRPEIKQAQEDARQEIVDLAEKKLVEHLNSTDDQISQRAAEYILKHLGASRGWSDLCPKQNIKVSKDGDITIQQIFGISSDDQQNF